MVIPLPVTRPSPNCESGAPRPRPAETAVFRSTQARWLRTILADLPPREVARRGALAIFHALSAPGSAVTAVAAETRLAATPEVRAVRPTTRMAPVAKTEPPARTALRVAPEPPGRVDRPEAAVRLPAAAPPVRLGCPVRAARAAGSFLRADSAATPQHDDGRRSFGTGGHGRCGGEVRFRAESPRSQSNCGAAPRCHRRERCDRSRRTPSRGRARAPAIHARSDTPRPGFARRSTPGW